MQKIFPKKLPNQFIWVLVIIFLQIIAVKTVSQAQAISPHTINNGGGFSSSIEWSIGESVSIAHFSTSNYNLNTGLLQPLTPVVTSINEFGSVVFGNEIIIGSNPTINKLQLKANLSQIGKMTIQLIDTKSFILQTAESGSMVNSYYQEWQLEKYPAGIFYLRVIFKPLTGAVKTGIYKIIKL